MDRRIFIVAVLVALGAGLTGCGEREQTASYRDGKYRGKPDGRSWDSQPPSYVSGEWTKGDRETWEKQMASRNSNQNEYRRIGH